MTTNEDYWIDQHEYLSEARHELHKRASKPPMLCWITNTETGEDGDEDYCHECAEKIVKEDEEVMCSAWYESDGSRFCEVCGCMLAYTLTDYGVNNELAHFLDPDYGGWDWNNHDECFEVSAILGSIDLKGASLERISELLMLFHRCENAPNFDLRA